MTLAKAVCPFTKECGFLLVPKGTRRRVSSYQDYEWIGLTAGAALAETLKKLRSPESLASVDPRGSARSSVRTATGVSWLKFVTGLGLGACLADDMGLGKTVQVIGLLLHRKSSRTTNGAKQANQAYWLRRPRCLRTGRQNSSDLHPRSRS